MAREDVTVISTLRLLIALETVLDDLGPEILSFMSKVHATEVLDLPFYGDLN